ncbi:diacylglycerol kinase [Halarcobacter bivalviorum]|uniref:Diacylglycerol kinase n=1 Tax=Halarcobacter bivalviorum TaxID=663364 RepID=A0AAX2AA16_9BACT|nr:diacylglycerol kinase [Halarcobacter bivalviorum]AXH11844.1 diacylglycerol kinase [Halarcobacter bivalviorum]RXK07166.1 diacylglycerol kinase [Halarcobacter bivalviorum]RXK10968.1 diacylglycerol kinase [Halarcobacter bivalviorum]
MNNKPKYHLFKNTKYALDGFIHAFKTESSFKLELFCAIFIIIGILLIDVSLIYKLILFVTGILVLIVELINSAIENVVDLVTKEHAPLAKTAKDIGSTAVMFTIGLHTITWIVVLIWA